MNYWLQRLGMAVLLLLAVSMLTFGAMNVLGDPLFNVLGPVADSKNVQGVAEIDGYALRTEARGASDAPTGTRTVVDAGDVLGRDQAVAVSAGDQLPKRADTVVALDAVDVAGGVVTLVSPVSPGSGVDLGPEPSQLADVAQAEEEFHLDRSLPVRYGFWLRDFVQGDMGSQFSKTGEPPVTDLIKERLPRSLTLLIMAQLFATLIAIPWALWSASRANTVVDRASTMTTFLIIALPNFALGVILKWLFAIEFEIFPQSFNASDPFSSRLWQMVLPAVTIALPAAAVYQRLLRTDLITTLQEDFILMARAKGVSRRDILFKHALRPSLFSFVTVFGINTGALIGGALIVENIFLIPGLGRAVVEAVATEDFPVVLAVVMIIAVAFVVVNVVIDVVYSIIDPRVRR